MIRLKDLLNEQNQLGLQGFNCNGRTMREIGNIIKDQGERSAFNKLYGFEFVRYADTTLKFKTSLEFPNTEVSFGIVLDDDGTWSIWEITKHNGEESWNWPSQVPREPNRAKQSGATPDQIKRADIFYARYGRDVEKTWKCNAKSNDEYIIIDLLHEGFPVSNDSINQLMDAINATHIKKIYNR